MDNKHNLVVATHTINVILMPIALEAKENLEVENLF
jgi:hypothetical protein